MLLINVQTVCHLERQRPPLCSACIVHRLCESIVNLLAFFSAGVCESVCVCWCVGVSNTFLNSLRLRLHWRIYQGLGVFLSHRKRGRGVERCWGGARLSRFCFSFFFCNSHTFLAFHSTLSRLSGGFSAFLRSPIMCESTATAICDLKIYY